VGHTGPVTGLLYLYIRHIFTGKISITWFVM
jgi:hypothetical protein